MLFLHPGTEISQPQAASKGSASRTANRVISLFRGAGGAVWRYLEEVGQARANCELRQLAARWSISDPELARHLRAATEFDARSRPASATSSQHLASANIANASMS